MLTYDDLLMAYDAALREALVSRLGGDDSLLPAKPRDEHTADRSIWFCARALFNDELRKVPPIPRRLHFSEEYNADSRKPNFEAKLSRLLRLLEAGDPAVCDPANEFLSRTVEHVFRWKRGSIVRGHDGLPEIFQDHMLYDWGIHHFHIEEGRGDQLLFVMLRVSDAYVLKIGSHGQDFAEVSVLEIAHRHWPALLPLLRGVSGARSLGAQQIGRLRSRNMSYVLDVGGQAVPPLELRAADGTPISVTIGQDLVALQLREAADGLAAPDAAWAQQLLADLGGQPDKVEVGLRFTPGPQIDELLFYAAGRARVGRLTSLR